MNNIEKIKKEYMEEWGDFLDLHCDEQALWNFIEQAITKSNDEVVREIEDSVYETIIPYGDALLDVLEETKKYGYSENIIAQRQTEYDVFRKTKTMIRNYFKTLDGHISSPSEYLTLKESE